MKKSTLALLAALVLLIGGASIGYNALKDREVEVGNKEPQRSQEQPKAQEPEESANTKKIAAPDFTVFDKQEDQIKLSDFKGRPTIINFWASW